MTVQVRQAEGERDLQLILALQRENLARSATAQEALEQGFVTVEHTPDVLRRMHAIEPSVVAVDGEALAGYALVMPVECSTFVPVLEPMFERMREVLYRGHPLMERRLYVMGQICVAKSWRGQAVFDRLYAAHREFLHGRYDCVVTEVAMRNGRSLRAHLRIGFEVIERYRDDTDDWALLVWDWTAA